ncbi:MAG: site-specific DNA-methyltransferase [Patescibacteria group bacterium]
MRLSDNEKRDAVKLIQEGKPLPDKYRFLLFDQDREVELVWNGKTNRVENTVLPFQTIEHIDEPREEEKIEQQRSLFDTSGRQLKGWTNKLIWGDNKFILSSLKNGPLRQQIEDAGGLKLIYIDPPFDVGADFSLKVEIGGEEFTKKPSVIEEVAYRDTWGQGADSFIAMMYERLFLMRDLLSDSGSIFVHCDYRVDSYLRMILDEVFGKDMFLNEIVWSYGAGGNPSSFFPRKHDTILWYSRGGSQAFEKDLSIMRVPYDESTLSTHYKKVDNDGRRYRVQTVNGKDYKTYADEGKLATDVWMDIGAQNATSPISKESTGYPTQKPEKLLERIISATTKEDDLIADFFCGSGTTLAVAEKLNRKWIGSDLGRFGIHTTRKRMIGVQRELKESGRDYRAFEILNISRYEREHFIGSNENLRADEQEQVRKRKENEFIHLILSAYKAEAVDSFNNFVGKKRDRLVAIGPVNTPVTSSFVSRLVKECLDKGISKADVLGFEYEMGIDFEETKKQGVDLRFRVIPNEVFDKKAVERGHIKFHDVAYLEAKPIIKGRGKLKILSMELSDFGVFYTQDDIPSIEESLRKGSSKVILDGGQVIKITKDKKTEIVEREVLTKKWTDWIDYWSVDFDYEDKKEIIRTVDPETKEEKEEWTGSYIFENEWQSFRTKKDRDIELISAEKEVPTGRRKVAVKVVDIFGNDTTKIIEVNV